MTKPIVYEQFLVKVYTDHTYVITHYFDKRDEKEAKKEPNLLMLFQVNALNREVLEEEVKTLIKNKIENAEKAKAQEESGEEKVDEKKETKKNKARKNKEETGN